MYYIGHELEEHKMWPSDFNRNYPIITAKYRLGLAVVHEYLATVNTTEGTWGTLLVITNNPPPVLMRHTHTHDQPADTGKRFPLAMEPAPKGRLSWAPKATGASCIHAVPC